MNCYGTDETMYFDRECPECGSLIDKDWICCPYCGHEVPPKAEGQQERPEVPAASDRLTTDSPKGNYQKALNLFYAKEDGDDRWVWIRESGDPPKFEDLSLCDFIRRVWKALMPEGELNLTDDDEELGEQMHELLFDGPYELSGALALLYTMGWAMAELREKLKAFEDATEILDHLMGQRGREGICPVCGAEIEYEGDQEIVDNGTVVGFTCPKCGTTGIAGYDLVFDAYYDVQKGDGA